LFVMSDVMWIVINHEENRPGPPSRANEFRLFVMSDVTCIVIFQVHLLSRQQQM
jgi:hypothetical protein